MINQSILNRTLISIAKWIFYISLLCLIYYQVIRNNEFENIKVQFIQQWAVSKDRQWIWMVLLLLPLNWYLEVCKWRTLLKVPHMPSTFKLFAAICTGISFSLFMPNRIGEYGGRVWWLSPESRWNGVIATLLGNFAQQIILLIGGMTGLFWFLTKFALLDLWTSVALLVICISLSFLLIFIYYNIDLTVILLKRSKKFRKWLRYIVSIRSYTNKVLNRALFYAFLRYMVYTLQYYFMLKFYQIDVIWWQGMLSIMAIFLLQTSIPLPPITGLVVRGEVAVYVWNYFQAPSLAIIASTFTLWLINLIIPGVLGILLLSRLKLKKTK